MGCMASARFHTLAEKHGVRAHVGAEIAVSSLGKRLMPPAWLPHRMLLNLRVSLCYVLRARDIRISVN